ncbi:unnamed protein product, partial [Closterium sp. NIES-54]
VEPGGAESEGAELGGAESERVEPGVAEHEGAEPGGAKPCGTVSAGGPTGASSRREPLSPLQLREWFARRTRLRSGAAGAGGATAGDTAAGGTGAGGAGAAGPGGARAGGTGAARAGGAAGGAGAGGSRAVGNGGGGTVRPRPYFVPLLCHVLSLPSSTDLNPPLLCPPLDQLQPQLQPDSPPPPPSPYAEQTDSLTERCEPASCSASPVRACSTGRRVPRPRSSPVPGTHLMTLRPSSVPQRVPVPSPRASSLPDGPDPESDLVCAAIPTLTCFLAIVVTDPSFDSTAASALSEFASPLSVGGECALGMDVLEDRHEDFEYLAAALPHLVSMPLAPEGDPDAPDIPTPRTYAEAKPGPYSSQWQTAMDAEMASRKTMLAALGFAPSTADPSLFLHTDTWLPPFYILVSFNASASSNPLPTGHSLSAPPSEKSVEPSDLYPELMGCLMYLMTCTRLDLAYPLSILARYVAHGRH